MDEAVSQKLIGVDDKTAFVLGNGPSLANVDLTALGPGATIGLNAAYRYWREIDWRPTYYACLDEVVGLSHMEAISELIEEDRIERFLLRANLVEALGARAARHKVVNFEAEAARTPLLTVVPITTGSHSALWAQTMGFEKIVLLGIDLDYKEIVEGARKRDGIQLEIVEKANNPNYFFDGYQQPGDRFNLPNPRPNVHLGAWHRAARALQATTARVYNANPKSSLKVFPKINLDDFLRGTSPLPPDNKKSEVIDLLDSPSSSNAPRHFADEKNRRLLNFIQQDILPLSTFIAITVLAGILASVILGPTSGIAALALCIALLAVIMMFYIRRAVVCHLADLEVRTKRQDVRIRELEHALNDRPDRPNR